jgi:predicted nucleotidyltransferase component of viral defense system
MTLKDILKERFKPATREDYANAIKRMIQELALTGLWRAKFFEHGAFYGGTALRILYGLPRFSEDLDFTLLEPDASFSLRPCFQAIRTELGAYGFEVEITEIQKQEQGQVESAFIKANTRMHLILAGLAPELARISAAGKLKVKFEVDTNPPHPFETEVKYLLQPVPTYIKAVTLEQMFAGKLHAVLCRNWRSRAKGRDWYDLVWFTGRGTACPLPCLESRMRQSGHWEGDARLNPDLALARLRERLGGMNLTEAKAEAQLFVDNPAELDIWSREFFEHCFTQIKWI